MLPDLKPKPAYVAMQTLTRELSGYRITRRLPLPSEKDYVLLCTGPGGRKKLAVWTTGEPHPVKLDVELFGRNRITGTTGNGDPFTPSINSGHLALDVAAAPKYVTLRGAVLR